MTEALSLTTALLIGLMGGTHCLGMCGGIAATVSISSPQGLKSHWLMLSYNLGRIISYGIAGAILGSLSWWVTDPLVHIGLRTFAGIMLILMGCYIAQWWQVLTKIEKAGNVLWRHISPAASRLLPVKTLSQAAMLGLLWGWLPCGLVYSTLIWASAANNWLLSAQLMLFFGLGTLPVMLLTGVLAQQVKQLMQRQLTKSISGSIIIIMGIITIPWHSMFH